MNYQLPKIALFALGGTIASVPSEDGANAIPSLEASSLIAAVPQLKGVAEIEATTFNQSASGNLNFTILHDLANEIREVISNGADGVVITQGTDTLEESSYLLDLLTDETKPIVITGAMRNPGLAGPDGAANLLAAVQVASSPVAHGLGPLVVFADQIYLARFVKKMHTSFIHAFAAPSLGPVGWISEGKVRIPVVPRTNTQTIRLMRDALDKLPKVAIVKVGIGDGLEVIQHLTDAGYDGVVIEAMGGGHLPSWAVSEVVQLSASMPVVFATRTGSGEMLESTYGFPGSERDLLDHGLISSGMLDGTKARILLILLLASGANKEEIISRFKVEAM